MTVDELKARLEKLPGDLEVWIDSDYGDFGDHPLTKVAVASHRIRRDGKRVTEHRVTLYDH